MRDSNFIAGDGPEIVIFSSEEDYKQVPKGWGKETWIANNSLYCGKILILRAGLSCSWHFHGVKDEVIFVESGEVLFSYGDNDDRSKAKTLTMKPGDSARVFPGTRHQMLAITDARLFEFSTEHRDEDSIRVLKGD